ncbi:MAG TPA: nitrogenase cofactor biosynthesis protein NifB [Paenibacillaceae bacterium]|nr:nitrogenase cofactor biosynthesis protein NifB [Paenibacillaceae bacterium]
MATQKKAGCSAGGGCSSKVGNDLEPHIQEKVAKHPCYSEDAHHHFARMHVAVAPGCNIQCNYCNRKYDCANESRPGVVSEVLKPEEAVKKVLVVAGKIPQMSVVGIAGPGDPLANPEKTFATFKGIYEQAPDIKLCLSTNGLRLIDYVEQIKTLNIDHVTITINAVDPEVGQHVYSWIYFEGKRYEGYDAAKILIQRQLQGLDALKEHGILCKVNSVLIPGVNDKHLKEVSRVVKEKGAFLHNIMPLIVAPGTVFEKQGIQEPKPGDLHNLQDECSDGNMRMMRHCRQCRADAVGLLGEDRSDEFTKEAFLAEEINYNPEYRKQIHAELEKKIELKKEKRMQREQRKKLASASTVRVAVASRGNGKINLHFGHAKEFMIYEVQGNNLRFVGIRKVQAYCNGTASCGDDKDTTLVDTIKGITDCQMLICSGIGEGPKQELMASGVVPIVQKGEIEEVILDSMKYLIRFNFIADDEKVSSK